MFPDRSVVWSGWRTGWRGGARQLALMGSPACSQIVCTGPITVPDKFEETAWLQTAGRGRGGIAAVSKARLTDSGAREPRAPCYRAMTAHPQHRFIRAKTPHTDAEGGAGHCGPTRAPFRPAGTKRLEKAGRANSRFTSFTSQNGPVFVWQVVSSLITPSQRARPRVGPRKTCGWGGSRKNEALGDRQQPANQTPCPHTKPLTVRVHREGPATTGWTPCGTLGARLGAQRTAPSVPGNRVWQHKTSPDRLLPAHTIEGSSNTPCGRI